jgi:hypothetical protein
MLSRFPFHLSAQSLVQILSRTWFNFANLERAAANRRRFSSVFLQALSSLRGLEFFRIRQTRSIQSRIPSWCSLVR